MTTGGRTPTIALVLVMAACACTGPHHNAARAVLPSTSAPEASAPPASGQAATTSSLPATTTSLLPATTTSFLPVTTTSSPEPTTAPSVLPDGQWYGQLVSVDVTARTLVFVPCSSPEGPSGSARPITLAVSPNATFGIYYRPGGSVVAGHSQASDLAGIRDAVAAGLPDFPPGWFVQVAQGRAVDVEEAGGITQFQPSSTTSHTSTTTGPCSG